jgi:hypothetical protein
MMMRRFVAAAALAFAQPACADVIMPGPPIVPIQITASQASKMAKAARSAALRIFNFSETGRATYLDDAYRAAGSKGITEITRVASARIIGDRAFVLALATKYLAPLVIGETYTYMQCGFDERGRVSAIQVDI